MATITVTRQEQNLPGGTLVAILKISGTIDASTVLDFQTEVLNELDVGINNVVLNCFDLDYINSTGMGQLIRLRDDFEEAKGSLELADINKKVLMLFKMLGLEKIFDIHKDVESAVETITALISPEPQTVENDRKPEEPRINFPIKINCSNCSSKLKISSPGKYRCPRCNVLYAATEEARVKFYATVKPRIIELKVPALPQFCEIVRASARAIAENTNFQDIVAELEAAVDEAANLVISKGMNLSKLPTFSVYMVCDEREFLCGFKAPYKILNEDLKPENESEKMTLTVMQNTMREITLHPIAGEGQILRLIRKLIPEKDKVK